MYGVSAPALAAAADEVLAGPSPQTPDTGIYWAEVERPAVSSKCGHDDSCIQGESADGFVHNGLSDSGDHV